MTKKLESRISELLKATSNFNRVIKYGRASYIDPELVVSLLHDGLRMYELAKMYGCSEKTLLYQIRLDYPDFDSQKHIRHGKYDCTPEEAANLYKKLKSVHKVGEALGLTSSAVSQRLNKLGINKRPFYRTDITLDKVVSLYRVWGNVSRIAKFFNASEGTIRERLIESGINAKKFRSFNPNDVRYYGRYKRDITAESVVTLYKTNKSMLRVAEILGVGVQLVRSRLKEAGISRDQIREEWCNRLKEMHTRKDIPHDDILRLYDSGKSIAHIAREYKCSQGTIRRVLIKNNIKFR